MNVMFIKESNKTSFIKKILKKTEVLKNKIVINDNLKNIKLKKKIKLVEKIIKILQKSNCKKVIVSKDLKLDNDFINLINSQNIDIINGRQLFKMYVPEIVSYIVKTYQIKINETKIAVLSNDYNRFIDKVIRELSSKCKFLSVVTHNIRNFERLEDNLRQDGIIISLSNNKRKSLITSEIILNFDFPADVLNMYNLYDKAILVNFEETIKIRKKRFNGKIFNWYELGINDELKLIDDKLEQYDFNELIEALYYMGELDFEKVYFEKVYFEKVI